MENNEDPQKLENQAIDYVTIAAKSVLGAIPIAGPLIAELAGILIPNQRIDRIAQYVEILGKKIANLEQGYLRAKLYDDNFSDLLEESLRLASHSLSDERREYLANLVASSLSSEDIKHTESRHLLRILAELNDVEVIWLAYYQQINTGNNDEFREKHNEILTPVVATFGSGSNAIDKEAVQNSYKEHLARLGLLKIIYKTDLKTHLPEFDRQTGGLVISRYQITPLGRLLLKEIGIINY
jgi:hypothetical protein